MNATPVILLALLLGGCALTRPQPAPRMEPTPPPVRTAQPQAGSLWSEETGLNLFADARARRVGDTLTVLLVERTDASKKAAVNSSRETNVDISTPTLFGRPLTAGGTAVGSFGVDSSQSFSGSGDAIQGNTLQGSITVVVAEVLANGHLLVRGEKNLELTSGSERIALSGIVRPSDITPSNTVSSDRVADARIAYGGRGPVADSTRPGWLARFFQSSWMPF